MSRNILEFKSIYVASERVRSLNDASKLNELKGFDLKEYFFEIVYHPKDFVKDFPFYVRGDTYEARVPVDKIKGTTHDSYFGKNWLVMLMNLKRHCSDHDVERVVQAINDIHDTDRIRLSKYGDYYFIDGGGNHRACQAKILGLDTLPAVVTEFVFNDESYRKSQRLWAIQEINPSFIYCPFYNDESIISLTCLGAELSLHFCDKEIDILEGLIQKAKLASKNPIKRMWNRTRSQLDRDRVENYILSRYDQIDPLCRALTAQLRASQR